jgi:DNA-directed RNA polymerase subunit RPC12/RpoP
MSDQQLPSAPPPAAPIPAAAVAASTAAPAGATAVAAPQRPQTWGRRYGFLCSYCSSRLEAVESMAGQSGTCPTCGNTIVIPILDNRGRLIDPTSGKVIKQDPHPVHAYAAAGHKAPQIVPTPTGDRQIRCPRCARLNPLAVNNCLGCGLPFTMEGTAGDAMSGTNTWAVASLVLGIVTIVGGFCLLVPPILAIIFGFIALRGNNSPNGQSSGFGIAIAGMILGTIGLVIGGIMWANMIR